MHMNTAEVTKRPVSADAGVQAPPHSRVAQIWTFSGLSLKEIISRIVFLCMLLMVFILKSNTKTSWVFLLFCFLLSLYTIISFDTQSTHFGFMRLYLLVLAFLPAVIVHLSLGFPENSRLVEKHPYIQLAPYILSTVLIIPVEIIYPRPWFIHIHKMVLIYLVIISITLVASSIKASFKRSSVLARQRAKVVLFGAVLAFPIPALGVYLPMLGVTIQLNFLAIPIMIFPASIAYAIVKHNLFDVDIYIKRAVGYVVMTTIVGMAYLLIQALASTAIRPVFGDYT